jgi:hypothetical protein
MRGTELGEQQAAQVEIGVKPQLKQHRTHRLQLSGRVRDAAKTTGYFRQERLPGRRQDELLVQPLEQANAQTGSSAFTCCPMAAGVT